MTVQLAPPIVFQSFLSTGAPNAFGTVATYIAGTTTPQATYPDSTQSTPNPNPIPLNALGQASIWLVTNLVYKIITFDASGNQINFQDQIIGGQNFSGIQLSGIYGTDSGAVNAYVFTHAASTPVTSLAVGTLIRFTPANTNTGASTLNADGTGAVAIIRANGSALTGGELSSLGPVVLQSTGTQWQIVSTAGAQPGFERTGAETSAGIIPVDYTVPNHLKVGAIIPDRYGINTTPGTTDMSVAVQTAVNLMISGGGLGLGCPLVFLGTAYSIVTPPTFGAFTASMLPIDIAGQGAGTQIINNAPTGLFGAPYAGVYGALFDMSARSGWRIRDLVICGNSAHKNDGIYAGLPTGNISTLTVTAGGSGYVNGTYTAVPLTGGSGTLALATIVVSGGAVTSATIVVPQGGSGYLISDTGLSASNANLGGSGSGFTASVASLTSLSNLWRIERVISFAAGVGLKARNTSSYRLDRFMHWPTGMDPTTLKVPQTVTLTDVNHGIWITGSFAQLGYIVDTVCLPRTSFAANMRGLKCDAATNTTLTVTSSDFESGSGVQLTGIDCANLTSAHFISVFNENSQANFSGCSSCVFQLYNGGIGGGIQCTSNSVNNHFEGSVQTGAGFITFDSSCVGNTLIADSFASVTDNAVPPNTYIGSVTTARGTNWGLEKLTRQVNTATLTPDCTGGFNIYDILIVTAAQNVTVAAPLHPQDAFEITICFRNQVGAAWTGTVSWNAIYKMATWSNPANGTSNSVTFFYDAADARWTQKASASAIPN